MPQSCRDVILDIWKDDKRPIGTNASLLMDRYLELSVKDDHHKDARDRLYEAIHEAVVQTNAVYKLAYAKHLSSIRLPKKEGFFTTSGRMVIGLGGENVLETGLSLQHTYGTPLIPGSAMKGITAHYCDQVYGAVDSNFKLGGKYHETLFGTTDDSGHIIFHDAWITPESLANSLKPDVMTPHHSEYYSKSDDAAPTDFDDPKPITFLSIAGSFHVVVSCDVSSDDGKKWTELAIRMLTEALNEWGIGGKTNAGYGRLMELGDRSTIEATTDAASNEGAISKPKDHTTANDFRSPPQVRRPVHKKGDVVEVIREADPNTKRGKAYFRADDGFGGFIQIGSTPSLNIGQKIRLEISGVMNEGYVFAVPGSKNANFKDKSKGGK